MSQRAVAKNHITEQRFNAYSKARSYIQHLNNVYDSMHDPHLYDQSQINHKLFKNQTPVNSYHKLSLMPNAIVAANLQDKIKLLNLFHTLSERKMKKNYIKLKSTTPVARKTYFKPKKYKNILARLSNLKNISNSHDMNSTFITSSIKPLKETSRYHQGKGGNFKAKQNLLPQRYDTVKCIREINTNFSYSDHNYEFTQNSYRKNNPLIIPCSDNYRNKFPSIKKGKRYFETSPGSGGDKESNQSIIISPIKQDVEVNTN
ncbi:hypothetical protein SteCoe_21311 [Stentor coeruleus]|uniref:Uncharacterized protein n=1 Tax=Stentor coeruleus TaxID=5963 RepID=A0A1R2BPW9_9CILI|nr:hypothetical protein SteCoe_21311 [Stentor coeruleus]